MTKEISSLWKVDVSFEGLMFRSIIALYEKEKPNAIRAYIFNRVMDRRQVDPSTIKDISMEPIVVR